MLWGDILVSELVAYHKSEIYNVWGRLFPQEERRNRIDEDSKWVCGNGAGVRNERGEFGADEIPSACKLVIMWIDFQAFQLSINKNYSKKSTEYNYVAYLMGPIDVQ